MRHFVRVLAIDPVTRGCGFAVLEAPAQLVDWGVKTTKGDKNAQCVRLIGEVIKRYRPDVLVVEDCTAKGSRRCSRVQELIQDLLKLAASEKVEAQCISRLAVRQAFSKSGVLNKYQVATIIAGLFPELAPQLPPFRKPWMSEDYRMSIFDAMAFALTFFYRDRIRK